MHEGFILRATGVRGNVVVRAIDIPSVIVYAQYNAYGAGSWPILAGQYMPSRDIALRAPAGGVTPAYEAVFASADNFVGFIDHAIFITPSSFPGFYNAAACPSSGGEWAAIGAITGSATDLTDPGGNYQAVVQLMSGGAKSSKVDAESGVTPRIATQQAYSWDDTYLSGLLGVANLRLGVRNEGSWSCSPYMDMQLAIRPVAYPPATTAAAAPPLFCVAQTAWTHQPYNIDPSINGEKTLASGVFMAGILPWPLVLDSGQYFVQFAYRRLAMLSDLGIPELVPQIASELDDFGAIADPLQLLRNMINCVGTVVGEVNPQLALLACTVDQSETEQTGVDGEGNPTYTTWTKTAHYVLRIVATTGMVTIMHATNFGQTTEAATHFTLPFQPDIPTVHALNQCNVDVLVGEDRVLLSYCGFNRLLIKTVGGAWPRIEHGDIDLVLLRDDGVEITTGLRLAGYTAIMPKYNGEFSVDGNLANFGFTSDADGALLFDIGSNHIGVLATQDQADALAQRIQLVVIDAITGDFIEARGVIGTYAPDTRLNAAGSCIQRDAVENPGAPDPGAVIPGVFLVGIARYLSLERDQYVSSDGGWTWVKYRTNVAGTPYYLGNQLHRAVIGHKI